ncbi:MAG: hypothetical protein V9G13_10660 [Marmoricola sp.]
MAEGLDIQPYTIKRLMNHVVNADVTGGYIQIDVERLRAPMQRITDTILTAGSRTEGGPGQGDRVPDRQERLSPGPGVGGFFRHKGLQF